MIKAQGTELFIRDKGVIRKVACVNSVTGISETTTSRDITTLCDKSAKSEPAFTERGQVDFITRLTYDNNILTSIQRSKRFIDVMIGLGDGNSDYPSSDRSWITFTGYITNTSTGIETNTVLPANVSIKVESDINILIQHCVPFSNGNKFSNGNCWR